MSKKSAAADIPRIIDMFSSDDEDDETAVIAPQTNLKIDKISTKKVKKLRPMGRSRVKLGNITNTSRSRRTFGVSKRRKKLKKRRYTHKGGIQLRQLELAVRRNRGPDGFPDWESIAKEFPGKSHQYCADRYYSMCDQLNLR